MFSAAGNTKEQHSVLVKQLFTAGAFGALSAGEPRLQMTCGAISESIQGKRGQNDDAPAFVPPHGLT